MTAAGLSTPEGDDPTDWILEPEMELATYKNFLQGCASEGKGETSQACCKATTVDTLPS